MPTSIHPTAVIDPGAEIGEDVSIGPYSIIGKNVKIGDGCRIASSVLIEGYTEIGRNNQIFHGASIGTIPQDLKYKGAKSFVRIGDNNIIREYVTINAATGEGESTVLGNSNLLMAYVHIAHNCVIGNNVILANAVNLAGHVKIHDYVIVGGITPVHQFVEIGAHAFVGGGSRIPKDVPPFIKVVGNPPKVNGMNSVGLMRRGFTLEQRVILKRAYCIIYRSGLNVSQAIEKIESELPQTEEIKLLVNFIKNSKRGITK